MLGAFLGLQVGAVPWAAALFFQLAWAEPLRLAGISELIERSPLPALVLLGGMLLSVVAVVCAPGFVLYGLLGTGVAVWTWLRPRRPERIRRDREAVDASWFRLPAQRASLALACIVLVNVGGTAVVWSIAGHTRDDTWWPYALAGPLAAFGLACVTIPINGLWLFSPSTADGEYLALTTRTAGAVPILITRVLATGSWLVHVVAVAWLIGWFG